MIIFDIEWNHGCDNTPLDEILQIGAVRLDRLGGKITGVFNVLIRPIVHRKLGVMAREVLDIRQFEDSRWDFPSAYTAFVQWCGDEKVFATWGNSDIEVLRLNCVFWNVQEPEWDVIYDIQESFSTLVGSSQRIALYRAVEYCKIPDCLDCHDALYDAIYTAFVGEYIPYGELVQCAMPRRVQRLSQEKYPAQPRRRIGPFISKEALLNSRDSRKAFCPICGRKINVSTWCYHVPRQFFADFCCPEHGWFICRLVLSVQEDGRWRGRLSVPALTEKVKREFHAATKDSQFICKPIKYRRKHHRKRIERSD